MLISHLNIYLCEASDQVFLSIFKCLSSLAVAEIHEFCIQVLYLLYVNVFSQMSHAFFS